MSHRVEERLGRIFVASTNALTQCWTPEANEYILFEGPKGKGLAPPTKSELRTECPQIELVPLVREAADSIHGRMAVRTIVG